MFNDRRCRHPTKGNSSEKKRLKKCFNKITRNIANTLFGFLYFILSVCVWCGWWMLKTELFQSVSCVRYLASTAITVSLLFVYISFLCIVICYHSFGIEVPIATYCAQVHHWFISSSWIVCVCRMLAASRSVFKTDFGRKKFLSAPHAPITVPVCSICWKFQVEQKKGSESIFCETDKSKCAAEWWWLGYIIKQQIGPIYSYR